MQIVFFYHGTRNKMAFRSPSPSSHESARHVCSSSVQSYLWKVVDAGSDACLLQRIGMMGFHLGFLPKLKKKKTYCTYIQQEEPPSPLLPKLITKNRKARSIEEKHLQVIDCKAISSIQNI
ncbi:unnamed protein product [Urochloa humidicola]